MTTTTTTTTTASSSSSSKGSAKEAEIVRLAVKDGIAVLTFDVPGERQNTLSDRSGRALQQAFERVEADASIVGAVLISGKPDFIAGADIAMVQACTTAEQVEKLSRDLQAQLLKMEQSKKPVVAAIHGSCLGGGLEVALACHWRLATDSPKTSLGLPEVMLGLLPGGGGTQRLPRLVGLQAALDMMLTGKNIRAVKAKRMGLVDQVTIPYGLEDAAIATCKRLVSGELKRGDRRDRLDSKDKMMEAALEDNAAGRALVFHQARATVMEKTLGLYPSPLAILDVVEAGYDKGIEAGYETESHRFGQLVMTNEAHSLMHLFFGQTSLKKNRYGKPKKMPTTVGVLGAGLMGSGIADVTVNKGTRVLMKDVSPESLARGQKAIWAGLDKRVKSRSLLPFERERIAAGVVGKLDYAGFQNCDIVIEAVFEDLAVKHKVLKEAEAHMRDDAVFASNTSALPIAAIAAASKRPENVVGMHYFSPVPKMPLLEVIVTDKTSKHAAALAVEVGLLQGKTVIVVKDGPGFYTTRILGPVMEEAAVLALEGVDVHAIDLLMRQTGFPVGPITLLDEVGIDVAAHVAKDMAAFFEPRFGKRDASALEAMVKQGFLGRKTNKGFFLYGKELPHDALSKARKMAGNMPLFGDRISDLVGGKGKPLNPGALEILSAHGTKHGSKKVEDKKELQDRVLLRMVNEAVQCLQEGILDNPVDGDIGAVFGLGFPPMTGGPFRYLDTVGAGVVASSLDRFAAKYGQRFTPSSLLVEHAKSGRKFHRAT
ncbi:MAG: 3-hydroxyacyl-CoA dehydrogenase NAD-binding domain-containing protein [Deltaproteobacteria bacterium]|nr:3-hydroxyacyl-CoA dehydrogenase NAD-binding domain-containing protein [Deltaproteobacteria bacterium]